MPKEIVLNIIRVVISLTSSSISKKNSPTMKIGRVATIRTLINLKFIKVLYFDLKSNKRNIIRAIAEPICIDEIRIKDKGLFEKSLL